MHLAKRSVRWGGGVVDGAGNAALYVNGNIPAGGNFTPINFATVSIGNFSIGARSDNNASARWNGSLDNIRIYNRVLTQGEIQQLQNE